MKNHFRHPRLKRENRSAGKDQRGQILDRISGDWEGDTVEGAGKSAFIATFVDKTMKYLTAHVMANKAPATLNRAAVKAFRRVPKELIKTLTVDNGKEFSRHKALGEKLGCPVY